MKNQILKYLICLLAVASSAFVLVSGREDYIKKNSSGKPSESMGMNLFHMSKV